MDQHVFDTIIVGAGTAGCLLANRLSKDPARRVLLIEAGRKDNYPWIHIPVGYLYCIGNPRTDWLYQTEAETGLNGRRLRYPRGKALGGCSSINGMIYMRGQARDYDGWAALTGNDEWNWANSLADFMAHEDHCRRDAGADPQQHGRRFSELHGHGGEWRVDKQRLRWEVLEAFAEAATEAGIPATDDFNTGDNFGVGFFEVNQKAGWRWNASKAFLRPIRGRANLEVWTEAMTERLLFETAPSGQPRCTSVLVRRGGQRLNVMATAEVIQTGYAVPCASSVARPSHCIEGQRTRHPSTLIRSRRSLLPQLAQNSVGTVAQICFGANSTSTRASQRASRCRPVCSRGPPCWRRSCRS